MGEQEVAAADVNGVAWDLDRDSASERRSLLRNLDPTPPASVRDLLNPDLRTSERLPLGDRARQLLLGCTVEDCEVLANEINAAADVDDDDEQSALADAIEEYEAVLGAHRLLKRDSDDRTIARMPVAERRRARMLAEHIDELQRRRYNPLTLHRRAIEGGLRRARTALDAALARGDGGEAAWLQAIVAKYSQELYAL